MTFTTIGIISLVLNIVLLTIITWLMVKYFEQKKQINNLVKELGSDSLEHYLKEIKKRGFDFILKPKDKKG